MTIRLSKAMQHALKYSPDHWRSVSPGPTVIALRDRGLVELRDTPGETGLMRGTQWRISDAGREVEGRGPAPTYDVAVWDHEGAVIKTLWDVPADDIDPIYDQYDDDPLYSVVVTER